MSDDKKKYSAYEWAHIEGGHTIEPKTEKLQLINTLSESRLFRNKKIADDVDLDDAASLAFTYLMLLNVLNKDYDYAPLAAEYSKRTVAFRNFNTFRTSGTDLYIALNRMMGKDQKEDNDKDAIARKRIKPNNTDLVQYLTHLGNSKNNPAYEQKMLMRFQRQLNVQDSMLKSLRRLVGDWDNLNQNQRALVVTRIVQYMRKKAPRSEMMQPLLKFQRRGNFMVDDSKDTKKNIWDKPIVKIGAAAAGIYAAGQLGKKIGKTSYQGPSKTGKKFQSRDK
jgi:hypothetical protein